MNTHTKSARARALRAARTVTLGLAIMGCSLSHSAAPRRTEEAPPDAARPTDAMAADSGDMSAPDAGSDAAGADAAVADAAAPCDPRELERLEDWDALAACCDAIEWDWDRGCMAWGPYVPPGTTLPPGRAARTAELIRELA